MEWNSSKTENVQNEGQERYQESPSIPPGLEALYGECRKVYPTQPNPLQVTALVKYWLGGPDPLDYISMFENPGDEDKDIPPHWHYISFGLSDLHGDGRVHEVTSPQEPSGFGFEISMRIKKVPGEQCPTWPAAIMQSLAKYVFQSDCSLCIGDHVSWHCALDNSDSRIQHMLMAKDPQLDSVTTPNGSVQFVQIVGVTSEELLAAQHWNGCGVLDIMKRFQESGGLWHITNMQRHHSIYDLDSTVAEEIETGIENDGSNLSGVSAKLSWTEVEPDLLVGFPPMIVNNDQPNNEITGSISQDVSEQIKSTLKKGLIQTEGGHHLGERNATNNAPAEVFVTHTFSSIHLTLNLESAALFPLALRGRLKHGRHFTFKSVVGNTAVTLVPPRVDGAFVNPATPYVSHGPWLQLFIPDSFLPELSDALAVLCIPDEIKTPLQFKWPNRRFVISVLDESV